MTGLRAPSTGLKHPAYHKEPQSWACGYVFRPPTDPFSFSLQLTSVLMDLIINPSRASLAKPCSASAWQRFFPYNLAMFQCIEGDFYWQLRQWGSQEQYRESQHYQKGSKTEPSGRRNHLTYIWKMSFWNLIGKLIKTSDFLTSLLWCWWNWSRCGLCRFVLLCPWNHWGSPSLFCSLVSLLLSFLWSVHLRECLHLHAPSTPNRHSFQKVLLLKSVNTSLGPLGE